MTHIARKLLPLTPLLIVLIGACGVAAPAATLPPGTEPPTAEPAQPTPTPPAATEIIPTEAPVEESTVYPIFENQTGFVMGGVSDGEWMFPDEVAAQVPGMTHYRLFTAGGLAGEVDGQITTQDEQHGPCGYPAIDLGPGGRIDNSIGVAGDWDVMPRPVTVLSPDIPEYQEPIAQILTEQGIANPEVIITGVVRADLDGDGTDEVVISASRLASGNGGGAPVLPGVKAGDYALLALRRIEGNEVKTLPFFMTTYLEDSDIAYPWRPSIVALLDLNGDGDLEIVAREDAYEGLVFDMFEVTPGGAELILTGGCSI